MKTKDDIIYIILSTPILSSDQMTTYMSFIQNADINPNHLSEISLLFEKLKSSCTEVSNKHKTKVNEANNAYMKQISEYFTSKKKSILSEREHAESAADKNQIDDLINQLP